MTKKERTRYRSIIQQLARLSSDGWAYAKPYDYEPLERELRQLNMKKERANEARC
jgi:hypothetical protein